MSKLEELSAKYLVEVSNEAVYSYFKEKLGLVSINYARKVLKVGEARFTKICANYNLQPIEMAAPNSPFKTKLFNLKRLYEIKKEIQENASKKNS